jgi:hypothetical protein
MTIINVTQDLISKLNYINTEGLESGQYNFPDFLIIGPQRTGTTWLHRNLLHHPNIFLPHTKELYFFNHLKIENVKEKTYTSDRLEWYASQFSINLIKYYKKNLTLFKSYRSLRNLDYNIKRFFSPIAKGEATASYAAMPEELIKEIFVLNPSIKILLMIRNPVERAWSDAKLSLLKLPGRAFEDLDFKEFENFYSNEYIAHCGEYTTIIQNWEKYTKTNNFFIGIFDNISKDPMNLLNNIFHFLDLPYDVDLLRSDTITKKINPTTSQKMPEQHKTYLQDFFKEEIQKLNKQFDLHW